MIDCNSILEQLNDHLDGLASGDVDALRQQAAADPDCLAMFDALMDVHSLLAVAPMAISQRDFATSVTRELARQKRRQQWAAFSVLMLAALTPLLPLVTLIWAMAALFLRPNLASLLISNALAWVNDAVIFAIALLTALRHLPPGLTLSLATLLSLSFLLLALASAHRAQPEFAQTSSS